MAPEDSPRPDTLRKVSSTSQQQTSRNASISPRPLRPRRQSTQDRINEILDNARERADSMSAQGRGGSQNLTLQRLSSAPELDEDIDENTGIMTARNRPMNYQSTQTSSSLRTRQPMSQRTVTDHDDPGDATDEVEEKHWLKEYLGNLWSVELENQGSVARDHLALERTFLAWLRTSLAFSSIGIAVTQLFRLNKSLTDGQGDAHSDSIRRLGKPLGATFLAISILTLFLGYHRYHSGQKWVMRGKFPVSRGVIMLVAFVAFALMVVSLGVVIFIQPDIS
ncbi:hypothetical protein GGR56DRAFT_623379 [Xylariaceae sp. FL0804]|nr:hypothetical protein GGR56DRAFT_623379 [Xylariaceae sp. FL0804]